MIVLSRQTNVCAVYMRGVRSAINAVGALARANDFLTLLCAASGSVDAVLYVHFVLYNGDLFSSENALYRRELAGVTPCTHELCKLTKHMIALLFTRIVQWI